MTQSNQSSKKKVRSELEVAGSLRWFHWVVVVLSLLLTVFAWSYSRKQLLAKTSIQFDREADQTVDLIIERMDSYEDVLRAGVAMIAANDSKVDYKQFERFAETIQSDQRYPGINGVGLIERFSGSKIDQFIEKHQGIYPQFRVHPHRDGEEYWPITSITPLESNQLAFGLDMAHESNRITAARKARDTGKLQVTGPIVLVQDSFKTPGFLFYAPFYDQNPEAQPRSRQQNFAGLVYAPCIVKELMEGVLDRERRLVGIRIEDSGETLFDDHLETESKSSKKPMFTKEVSVPIYGRTWKFNLWTADSFHRRVDFTQPYFILATGLLIDGLLIILFLLISRTSRQALDFADALTLDVKNLSLVAKHNRIGIWDYDPNSNALHWDDTMFELYGRSRDDFSASYDAWADSLHPEDRSEAEQLLSRAVDGDGVFECDFRIVRPDGSVRYISANANVFRDEDGKPARILGANTDISARMNASLELNKTRRLQEAIQKCAGVSIIATDIEGTIVLFNSTAEDMLGYRKEDLLHQQSPGIFHDPAEIVQRAEELSKESGHQVSPGFDVFVANLGEGKSEQREWTYVRKDGSKLPVLLTVTAMHNDDHELTGYLGIAADISERKIAIEKLKSVNLSLAQSNEELAQFAYVASHDLQEPLRKVTSFCELLQQDCGDQLNEDGRQYMSYIVDGAVRMRTLIRDLLTYSRVQSEPRQASLVDVNESVQCAVDNLWEAIRESGAVVTYDDLPEVHTDAQRLAQLFQNLIGNAIKYCSDKNPEVKIGWTKSDSNWVFSVEDNGIGIEPRFREQIFGVFKRLHSRSEYSGTGIGLAICKRIVDRLDGKIWIDDAPGGGSIFYVQIPVKPTAFQQT